MRLTAFVAAAMAVAFPGIALIASERTPVDSLIATGTINSDMPPERFRGDSVAVVVFTDRAGIDEMCGMAQPGFVIVACHQKTKEGISVITMPNPAPFGERGEWFAKIMSHELGHANGWGPEHEQ